MYYLLPRMFVTIIFISLLLSTTLAAPQFSAQRQPVSNEAPAPYDYQYKVENPPTNTYFGKNEAGDAAGRVTGSYYVYLPDGKLLTVDYSVVGDSGFVPRISLTNNNQPATFQG